MTSKQEVTDIFRYTPVILDGIEFATDPKGDWVRFEDVAPELAQLRAEVKRLRTTAETTADRMLAQLCAKSGTGVHVRKPDGVCVHCGAQANELSEDLARAATLENDGHGYTIWRIGGRQFVPLDEANEAVRLARESAVKTNEQSTDSHNPAETLVHGNTP